MDIVEEFLEITKVVPWSHMVLLYAKNLFILLLLLVVIFSKSSSTTSENLRTIRGMFATGQRCPIGEATGRFASPYPWAISTETWRNQQSDLET